MNLVSTLKSALNPKWILDHFPLFSTGPEPKILFIANNVIPTLQLSFLTPLKKFADQKKIQLNTLTEEQIKKLATQGEHALENKIFSKVAPDIIVFCRYSGPNSKDILEACKKYPVKTMYHIDDDLLNVPLEIGQKKYEFHNRPDRKGSIDTLLKNVDLIYCSTKTLLNRLKSYGYSTPMVHGEVYCAGRVLAAPHLESKKFGYMGFDHAHDLAQVLPSIVSVLDQQSDISFELFGSIPKPQCLERFGSRVKTIEPIKDYSKFMEFLASLQWAVGICPLADTPFNSLKANTKWVEYTAAGFAVVATQGTIYDGCLSEGRGVLLPNDNDQWTQALSKLMSTPQERQALVTRSQKHLTEAYSQDALRAQVIRIFNNLSPHKAYATSFS